MKKTRIIMWYFVAAFMCALAVFISCQDEVPFVGEKSKDLPSHRLGCLLLPSEKYMSIALHDASTSLLKAAPAAFVLKTPPVGDQGDEGSCVAWGVAYAGRSISWMSSHPGQWDTTDNIFSPEYVYNQIKTGSCTAGAYVVDGLRLLVNQGVVPWDVMPYSDQNGCSLMPTAAQRTTAASYRVSGYSRVSITINAIKAMLLSGKPVIVGGPVNRAFVNLNDNSVLKAFVGASLGGHCYCVVGYNDMKKAFLVYNSWGTIWGDGGFGYISYSYISRWWQEAYSFK